jgi:hypothetical protein
MGNETRLRRPEPERTGPIRSFASAFSAQSTGKTSDETAVDHTARGPTGHNTHGVELAYQVINQYLNDGRQAAARLNGENYNTRPVTDRLQEVIERTVRLATDLLPLWLEALVSAVRIDPPPTPSGSQSMAPVEDNREGADRGIAISIEMIASQPVTVSLDLREHSEQMPLMTLGLRGVDPNKPELSDIHIEPDEAGGIKFRIQVPPATPPGIYCGVIVDRETGGNRGTLSLHIAPS